MGKWYKGCMHSHTTESDGDASPEDVARWFQSHGYDWLIISDHNTLTSPNPDWVNGGSKNLLMISGEEITAQLPDEKLPVYVNAFDIPNTILPVIADDVLSTLQSNIDAVIKAGGLVSFGAPYYRDRFDHKNLVNVAGPNLMEIFNAHPMNVKGDPRSFSYEDIWDMLLGTGRVIYGTATDDCHNYFSISADHSNPGRAWVMVQSDELSEQAILRSLVTGNFYASTGVLLNEVHVSKDLVELNIKQHSVQLYNTTIIGKGGIVLDKQPGVDVSYKIRGNEGYIRARVDSSWGARAWIQPIFLD